mmetsp:Transcript_24509/g.56483  ORF Transcript_24509/g.56483 Transcript_24509/m.56483 type:complete len:204 (-) Transcript_24509:1424-2035(-)
MIGGHHMRSTFDGQSLLERAMAAPQTLGVKVAETAWARQTRGAKVHQSLGGRVDTACARQNLGAKVLRNLGVKVHLTLGARVMACGAKAQQIAKAHQNLGAKVLYLNLGGKALEMVWARQILGVKVLEWNLGVAEREAVGRVTHGQEYLPQAEVQELLWLQPPQSQPSASATSLDPEGPSFSASSCSVALTRCMSRKRLLDRH